MRIATLAGIPVRLHWSFLGLVAVYFVVVLIGTGLGQALQLLGIAAALFSSVVLHEFGHAMAARYFGIRTAHITLYPFGGIAAITRPPSEPRHELVIALAGPAVNFVLFAVFGALGLVLWWAPPVAIAALNLIMGLFNLLPAYPMDGGRVLRALLADRLGWVPASRFAMRVGKVFAWVFLGVGLVSQAWSLVLVGGFLLFALAIERRRLEGAVRQAADEELLRHARFGASPQWTHADGSPRWTHVDGSPRWTHPEPSPASPAEL